MQRHRQGHSGAAGAALCSRTVYGGRLDKLGLEEIDDISD